MPVASSRGVLIVWPESDVHKVSSRPVRIGNLDEVR